jgi:serine/threonine protein kinase
MRKSSRASDRRTSLPDEPYVPEAGSEPFPGYRLLRLRGRGGFATVWEASSPSGELVALKFMSSGNGTSAVRELRSLQGIQRLSHPNLLRIRDVWSVPGNIVIAMDLADASLLDLFLLYAEEFQTPVDPTKLCLYLYKTAQALDFLNSRRHTFEGRTVGFQHGDIKPNNILLLGDEPKLADYGLATPMNGPNTPCSRAGTMEYAAPEVFQGMLTDTSDQFSLGVTYYLLRTGAFPFPPPPRVPGRSFTRPAPELAYLSAEEQPILSRALSPVPQNRYPNCVEFMNQILKALKLELVQDPIIGLMVRPASKSLSSRSGSSRSLRVEPTS